MRRQNGLDRIIHTFQHRWETDRQFRAALSGVLALALLLSLCACLGVATTVTNVELANFSGTGQSASNGGSLNTGTGPLTGNQPIPTNTVAPWASPSFPQASPNPNSQTPAPSPTPSPTPTDPPTATPCTSNCGGGGGGGSSGTVTAASWSPNPWNPGSGGSVTIHTSSPNIQLLVFSIQYPGGNPIVVNAFGTTDGSGNFVYNVSVPSGVGSGQVDLYIKANFSDGLAQAHIFVPVA
ncbi:MAG: hypothetical protein ABI068_17610 [Ktedonobacterales bacterium]